MLPKERETEIIVFSAKVDRTIFQVRKTLSNDIGEKKGFLGGLNVVHSRRIFQDSD